MLPSSYGKPQGKPNFWENLWRTSDLTKKDAFYFAWRQSDLLLLWAVINKPKPFKTKNSIVYNPRISKWCAKNIDDWNWWGENILKLRRIQPNTKVLKEDSSLNVHMNRRLMAAFPHYAVCLDLPTADRNHFPSTFLSNCSVVLRINYS